MIAQVIEVTEGGQGVDMEQVGKTLQEQAIPNLSQAPGFIAAYWLRGGDGSGMTVMLWADENSQQQAEQRMASMRDDSMSQLGIQVSSMKTYEVFAQAQGAEAKAAV